MANPQVTIYSDANYSGSSKSLGVGSYSRSSLGISNDSLSSLRIPSGLMVTLYENDGFQGRASQLVQDTPHLGGANDMTSSLVIEAITTPVAIFYTDANFSGWSFVRPAGSSDSDVSFNNDRISSVYVPAGMRVTLYEDTGFGGQFVELTESAAHLGDMADETSSIMVDQISQTTPTLSEVTAAIKQYGPRVYFHPDDEYRPSSVDWFLQRATLHCADGSTRAASAGALPAGGSDDHQYWLECNDSTARAGSLSSAVAYVNAVFKGGWLDIQFWIFYPYNGAGTAAVKIKVSGYDEDNLALNPMGQHGGDWEHFTCRIDPVTKKLRSIYLAQHDGGTWTPLGDIPMDAGRPVVYSSRHGHASYCGTGNNLSSTYTVKQLNTIWFQFGLVNAAQQSSSTLECSSRYQILRIAFLSNQPSPPDWTKYCRRWGPHIEYKTSDYQSALSSINGIGSYLNTVLNKLPDEMKEEDGPTGPWMKGAWNGDGGYHVGDEAQAVPIDDTDPCWARCAILGTGWRTAAQIATMSDDDARNTLISEVSKRCSDGVTQLQTQNNRALAEWSMVTGWLLDNGVRTAAQLSQMDLGSQRNTIISELSNKTSRSASDLQAASTFQLLVVAHEYSLPLVLGSLPSRLSMIKDGSPQFCMKDTSGVTLDVLKVIEVKDSAGVSTYYGVHHHLGSQNSVKDFELFLVKSSDLKSWTRVTSLGFSYHMGDLRPVFQGKYLLANEQTGQGDDPNQIRLRLFASLDDLCIGRAEREFLAPANLSSTQAEGTPTIREVTGTSIDSCYIVLGQHYMSVNTDRQSIGVLINFKDYYSWVNVIANEAIHALGFDGKIGGRDCFIYNNKQFFLHEAQLVNDDWSSWRIVLGNGKFFVCLDMDTGDATDSCFANPRITQLLDNRFAVTLFMPTEGNGPAHQGGELLYTIDSTVH